MPATQWVVEYTGCEEDPVARVKVVNREYSNVAFEGQLYKADDNVFIINRHNSCVSQYCDIVLHISHRHKNVAFF